MTSDGSWSLQISLLTKWLQSQSQSQSHVTIDNQSPSLSWCQAPSGAQDQTFVTARRLRVCCCGSPSLTREWDCRLQMLLVLASAARLGSEFRGTHDHRLLSQIRDSPNLEGQVPVFRSPRPRVAQMYPQALGSLFVASYDSQSYGGRIRNRLHAENYSHSSQSQSYFTTGGLPPVSSSWNG
jgi:hypothetical protein